MTAVNATAASRCLLVWAMTYWNLSSFAFTWSPAELTDAHGIVGFRRPQVAVCGARVEGRW